MSTLQRLVVLMCALLFCTAAAMAQVVAPTSIFQLDGNAANSNLSCTYGQPCDYWNLLNGQGNSSSTGGVGTGSQAGHSMVRTFVNGTASTDSFTGGGSKDPNPISQWAYSTSPTPNKDTLNAAYAAAYNLNGHFEITFGADRLSPNGDANIGIWFFQQQVGPNGSGGFTGAHADHDIFLISSFTNGGGASTITALEWDHTCASGVKNPTSGQCADTNLRLLANVGIANVCTSSSPYCAITNPSATTTTWEGSIASPLFFQGGVDITAALAAVGITQLPCFSSFLVETRSSQSTSAVLKDFIGGGFPVCGMTIAKSCGTASVNTAGTAINYPVSGSVTNTGIGTLFNVTVFDTIGNSTTPNQISVTNNTTGSQYNGTSTLAAGDTGTWSDTSSSTSNSQSDTAYAQAAVASGAALTVTSSNTAQATCTLNPTTTLSVTKTCGIPAGTNPAVGGVTLTAGTGGTVNVLVNYSGMVCNNGPVQVTGVLLKDFPSTSTTGVAVGGPYTLAPSGQAGNCASYSGTYAPSVIDLTVFAQGSNVAGSGPGRYYFNDLVTISAASTPISGALAPLTGQTETRCNGTYGCATQSCPLCQGSGECTTP